MDAAALQATLDTIAADYVKQLQLRVESVFEGDVTLSLPVSPAVIHAGGVLCGQAIMSAADTAMLLAMISKIGQFRPMTTVQLQTSFLRPVPKGASIVEIRARVLRYGKTLSYGEVLITGSDGRLAAHCTSTYSRLS